jgi:Second Messenger Oligonucleotide or Dinucleotide Synthetase domain
MDIGKTLYTEDSRGQLDDLLWRVCEEIQLPTSRYDRAVTHYEAVSDWLDRDGSVLSRMSPSIYPQGSMKIGTTVKPLSREEHDLDFVCEVREPASNLKSPLELLNLLVLRLRQNETYASVLEVKNRCVRLAYQKEFHMDILPACLDTSAGGSCILVPDRESGRWKASNPKGFADWFEQRCQLPPTADEDQVLERAESVPAQQATREKETLKRVVQLLKRWRDIRYQLTPEIAPISMVLTTLAADKYGGQRSLAGAVTEILDGVISLIEASRPRIYILNPANPQEDLSERWEERAKYDAFVEGIRELHSVWGMIFRTKGVQRLSQLLKGLFGEPVTEALAKQTLHLQELRESSALKVGAGGLIATSQISGVRMRPNTFHGKK